MSTAIRTLDLHSQLPIHLSLTTHYQSVSIIRTGSPRVGTEVQRTGIIGGEGRDRSLVTIRTHRLTCQSGVSLVVSVGMDTDIGRRDRKVRDIMMVTEVVIGNNEEGILMWIS